MLYASDIHVEGPSAEDLSQGSSKESSSSSDSFKFIQSKIILRYGASVGVGWIESSADVNSSSRKKDNSDKLPGTSLNLINLANPLIPVVTISLNVVRRNCLSESSINFTFLGVDKT